MEEGQDVESLRSEIKSLQAQLEDLFHQLAELRVQPLVDNDGIGPALGPVRDPWFPPQQPQEEKTAGRYEISVESASGVGYPSASFANQYYDIGGKTYRSNLSPIQITWSEHKIIALRVSATGTGSPSATIVTFDSLGELQTAQENLDYYTIPLYEVDQDGAVLCDFRTGPQCAMGEF